MGATRERWKCQTTNASRTIHDDPRMTNTEVAASDGDMRTMDDGGWCKENTIPKDIHRNLFLFLPKGNANRGPISVIMARYMGLLLVVAEGAARLVSQDWSFNGLTTSSEENTRIQ
jgi:hypothetical protein